MIQPVAWRCWKVLAETCQALRERAQVMSREGVTVATLAVPPIVGGVSLLALLMIVDAELSSSIAFAAIVVVAYYGAAIFLLRVQDGTLEGWIALAATRIAEYEAKAPEREAARAARAEAKRLEAEARRRKAEAQRAIREAAEAERAIVRAHADETARVQSEIAQRETEIARRREIERQRELDHQRKLLEAETKAQAAVAAQAAAIQQAALAPYLNRCVKCGSLNPSFRTDLTCLGIFLVVFGVLTLPLLGIGVIFIALGAMSKSSWYQCEGCGHRWIRA